MKPLSPETHAQLALAFCLALISGYLDGYGLLVLGTYVSFMSGNTTFMGLESGRGQFHAAAPAALAIVVFVAGSFLGNLLTHSRLRHAHRVRFGLIAVLLAITAGVERNEGWHTVLAIAMLSLAMGMMNSALPRIGAQSVSLTFVTGTLNRIGGHLASAARREPLTGVPDRGDSHLHRARVEASIWVSFLAGALLSATALGHFREWALLPPVVVMLALAFLSRADLMAMV